MSPAPQVKEVTYQENSFGLDNFLWTALENPRDRLTILKLDQELEAFIKDSNRTRLDFPPTSSYQRLIVHRVAQYFRLDHVVIDVEGGKRAVVLFKTSESRVPVLRFVDLIEQPEGIPAKAVKIMRRGQNDLKKTHSASSGLRSSRSQNLPGKDRTLEEREEEYAKARARIFGKDNIQMEPTTTATKMAVQNTNIATVEQIAVQRVPVASLSSKMSKDDKEENKQKHSSQSSLPTRAPISQNESAEYNRNVEGHWSRLWNPSSNVPSMESVPNYDYYDISLLNYRNDYPNNWTEANSNASLYSNYLTSPNPPPMEFITQPPSIFTTPVAPQQKQQQKSSISPSKDKKPISGKDNQEGFSRVHNPHVRKNPSPPSTPSFYPPPRTPPPIIYTYPNEDMWSFYSSGVAYPNPPVGYSLVSPAESQMNPYYYDYERRPPPKSTELFDPNAPTDKPRISRPVSIGTLDDLRQMQNFPRSPSHDSFFQFSQAYQTKQKAMEATQLPIDMTANPKPNNTTGTQLEHILEIKDLSRESISVIGEIEQSGAIIKWVDDNTAIAIYKTANAAKEALSKFQDASFSLQPWRVPLRAAPPSPINQLANLSIQ